MGRRYTAADDSVLAFKMACEHAESVAEIETIFLSAVAALGFKYAAVCNRVHLIRPPPDAVVILNLPPGWAEHYAENGYHLVSGQFQAVQRGAAPFFWSEPRYRAGLTPGQVLILDEARDFGLSDAFTWSILVPGAGAAACTLATEDGVDLEFSAYATGGVMGLYAYQRARELLAPSEVSHLSYRERQCLTFAADGKSDWAIAQILHLSQSTIHNTLERAKARLGVSTRIQAVVRALALGEIVLGPHNSGGAPGLDDDVRS